MPEVNKAEVCWNLKTRFHLEKTFSWIGDILISLNPNNKEYEIKLFPTELLMQYVEKATKPGYNILNEEPHIYPLGAQILYNLIN